MVVMNKEFIYNENVFNIKVELNYKSERRINGHQWHRITITDTKSGNWTDTLDIEAGSSHRLASAIRDLQNNARRYTDGLDSLTAEEYLLIDAGFKK